MKKINTMLVFVFAIIFVFIACEQTIDPESDPSIRYSVKSETIPMNGTVFVGREYSGNAIVVVIYENTAYIGYHKEKETTGYATLKDRFTRLTLVFDGYIYKVTNWSSLWASAWMHDAYPQGLVFNEDGSMSWVSPVSFSGYKGPSVTLDGIQWPFSSFTRLDNLDVDKQEAPVNLRIENLTLNFDSLNRHVYIEQSGETEMSDFGMESIDLTNWNFKSAGVYQFKLRSLGGYPTYDEKGYLKKLTVSSDLSVSYVNLVVELGKQLATPTNLRIVERAHLPGFIDIRWDPVPDADSYTVSNGFGNTGTWASLGYLPGTHSNTLSVGIHKLTVVAHRRREVIDGIITFFPSSEASLILTINSNGTFSYF
jgi:hypothetical protein